MEILIDSSVWIDYFQSGEKTQALDNLIDQGLIASNDLILTELLPFLMIKKQHSLINTLNAVKNFSLNIDWSEIQDFQLKCLKSGLNGVGIPDLIIAQNALQNDSYIYSLNKHFRYLEELIHIRLFN